MSKSTVKLTNPQRTALQSIQDNCVVTWTKNGSYSVLVFDKSARKHPIAFIRKNSQIGKLNSIVVSNLEAMELIHVGSAEGGDRRRHVTITEAGRAALGTPSAAPAPVEAIMAAVAAIGTDIDPTPVYEYGMRNRPAWSAAPKGWVQAKPEGLSAYEYGTVVYDHKLTSKELYDYEMYPVSANAYEFEIGATVWLNEVDPAVVVGYEDRGAYKLSLRIPEFAADDMVVKASQVSKRDVEPSTPPAHPERDAPYTDTPVSAIEAMSERNAAKPTAAERPGYLDRIKPGDGYKSANEPTESEAELLWLLPRKLGGSVISDGSGDALIAKGLATVLDGYNLALTASGLGWLIAHHGDDDAYAPTPSPVEATDIAALEASDGGNPLAGDGTDGLWDLQHYAAKFGKDAEPLPDMLSTVATPPAPVADALTAAERKLVETTKTLYRPSYDHSPREDALIAIIDRLAPRPDGVA